MADAVRCPHCANMTSSALAHCQRCGTGWEGAPTHTAHMVPSASPPQSQSLQSPQSYHYAAPGPAAPPPVFYKNPSIGAVLSFLFMGLGQIYNGQIGKGVVFIILYGVSWLLCLVVIGFITTPVLWILGMIDAYSSAQGINRRMYAEETAQPEPR